MRYPRILRLKPEERIENASQPWHSPSRGRDEPRHHPQRRRERPKRRRAPPELPGPLRSLRSPYHHLARRRKRIRPRPFSRAEGNSSAQPPAKEPRAAPVTVEEERPDIGPRYTDEEVRRLHLELFVQLGPAPPTAGVPQPIPVEKTLLDRLAEISRPEAMSGTAKEDQAVRDVVRDPDLPCIVPGETSEASMARYSEQMVAVVKHWTMEKADGRTNALTSVRPLIVTLAKFFLNQIPQVPGLTIPAPATDRIDELQVLCTAVASWAGDLKQEVAEDRRTRSILTEWANGAQVERDAARQKYELSVSPHPTLGELMEAMDARIQSAKTDAARLREHASQIMSEWQNSNIQWRTSLNKEQAKVDKQTEDLKALQETYCLITTPEEPTARDLVECLVSQNSIADNRAEEAKKRI
ncbi:hypothetical protein R1flu_001232 [Riccia fluitans]|uniref:Uncharacterized protein n=1 Tax=Riccia fluitans TaxID=41844 RepID=A0ABD1Y2Q8_9MARC